jgi:hypothetical protein
MGNSELRCTFPYCRPAAPPWAWVGIDFYVVIDAVMVELWGFCLIWMTGTSHAGRPTLLQSPVKSAPAARVICIFRDVNEFILNALLPFRTYVGCLPVNAT